MKNIYTIILATLVLLSSCNDWLTQDDNTALSPEQAYSSVAGISSIASNLYSRLRYSQDFGEDYDPYGGDNTGRDLHDMGRWDEASHNSAYWEFSHNVDRNYRQYYDYGLIRDVNLHIKALNENVSKEVPENKRKYFLAEARYIRAFVYFTMVSRMGGVPIIEVPFDYTDKPEELARARNKEADVYDFIAKELDEILEDLAAITGNVKTRATKGSALALKSRAMLYAGTIAYNHDKGVLKGLILPSGATGIDKSKAKEYFQKALDAYKEIELIGYYSLYSENSDLSTNYSDLFQKSEGNREIILCRDYDGKIFQNDFTSKVICAELRAGLKTGCELNPVLNLVNDYEKYSTRRKEPINPYVGAIQNERMANGLSTVSYKVYDKANDIFADRDPRLAGTILFPGSSFRGVQLDFRAGLAIKQSTGYDFKTVDQMENIEKPIGMHNGVQITGKEGPHRTSTNISHSGFLMRKFTDVNGGSEAKGASTVPYVIFRYAEVLLNTAEAAFYLSEDGVDAYDGKNTRNLSLECINKVRERAGGAAFKIQQNELDFARIANERRVELAFEDHRYKDLKRWRMADEVWAYDVNNATSVIYGLWPYKIYAPGDADDGKWIYRRVKLEHRGTTSRMGDPLNFDRTMYYATYPTNEGNSLIEKNPNH